MRKMYRICTLVLVLLLTAALSVPAFAAGTVTYDAGARDFIFAPGSEESPTNLFPNFQNVMPGDVLTEQIVIKNDPSKEVKIKLYIRSKGAQEETDDFLSQLTLTVEQEGDSVLFSAPADQTAQLTDWVYLGTVYSGGEIVLNVTLNVPLTMGNKFQDQTGYIDWEFKVEELPVEPDDPDAPATGDHSNLMMYVIFGCVSIAAFAVLLVLLMKRRKQEEE